MASKTGLCAVYSVSSSYPVIYRFLSKGFRILTLVEGYLTDVSECLEIADHKHIYNPTFAIGHRLSIIFISIGIGISNTFCMFLCVLVCVYFIVVWFYCIQYLLYSLSGVIFIHNCTVTTTTVSITVCNDHVDGNGIASVLTNTTTTDY